MSVIVFFLPLFLQINAKLIKLSWLCSVWAPSSHWGSTLPAKSKTTYCAKMTSWSKATKTFAPDQHRFPWKIPKNDWFCVFFGFLEETWHLSKVRSRFCFLSLSKQFPDWIRNFSSHKELWLIPEYCNGSWPISWVGKTNFSIKSSHAHQKISEKQGNVEAHLIHSHRESSLIFIPGFTYHKITWEHRWTFEKELTRH